MTKLVSGTNNIPKKWQKEQQTFRSLAPEAEQVAGPIYHLQSMAEQHTLHTGTSSQKPPPVDRAFGMQNLHM